MPRKGLAALPSDGRVLSTYTPTLRERMADALRRTFYSDDRAGQQQAEKVMNYAEAVTPVGLATGMYDAGQNAGHGNYGLAALQLGMAGIPGPNPKGIRAFHGSPHSFDRFDMSKIGTGEGAQAYGHGLYFAENEGIARSYRDNLSPTIGQHNSFGGQRLSPSVISKLQKHDDPAVADFFKLYANRAKSSKDLAQFADDVIARNLKEREMYAARAAEYRANPPYKSTYSADDYEKFVSNYDRQLVGLQRIRDQIKHEKAKTAGHMYEVNIDADPNSLLDWDKPLSEQPKGVKRAVKDVGVDTADWVKGGDIYEYIGNHVGNHVNSDVAVSELLRKNKVPGIRYLDAGSRAKGDGSRNYVMFDDKLVKIIRKYGLAALLPAGAYAAQQPTDAQAATP